jgi:hypothetical protein
MNELLAAAPPEVKQQWASWMRPEVFSDESESMGIRPVSATASAINTLDSLYKSATITTHDPQWATANEQLGNPGSSLGASTMPSASTTSTSLSPSQTNAPLEASNSSPRQAIPAAAGGTAMGQPEVAEDSPHTIPFPGVQSSQNSPAANLANRAQLQENMNRVLALPAEELAQLLSGLDSQTILLALAGASTQFMKRFREMLEPEDAKVLDDRIQRIGPVTLRQIDEAQQRLVVASVAYFNPASRNRAA